MAPADKWRGRSTGSAARAGRSAGEELAHRLVLPQDRHGPEPAAHPGAAFNNSDLPNDTKVKLQGYVTGCYGSLTSFNVLFADEDDRFKAR